MIRQTLMAAVAAIALGSGAGQALSQTAMPRPQGFAQQISPRAPDYSRASSWAATPRADAMSGRVPPGGVRIEGAPGVDVFYIYPTTFRSETAWNADIADPATNAAIDAGAIARQGGLFNGCCRVFAPRYRQASGLSSSDATLEHDGGRALDLGYADILRAFDHYIENDNHGRPFILAGQGQGGLDVARLLEDRIDNAALAERMVAAYAVGASLSVGDFGTTYKTLQICATASQTGCVVAWNSVLPGDAAASAAASGRYRLRHGEAGGTPGSTPVCVNPLTFDLSQPDADRSHSLGALPADLGDGNLRPLVPRSVAARCQQGMLVVDADPALGSAGALMQDADYGLFYADVRANAVARAIAWRTDHGPQRHREPLFGSYRSLRRGQPAPQ
ncbi:DUF3089 domain-containing protein [soil metagenome]